MAIVIPPDLTALTSPDAADLVSLWDVDSPATQKMKKTTVAEMLASQAGTTGLALFGDETPADARTTLELGTMATETATDYATVVYSDAEDAKRVRIDGSDTMTGELTAQQGQADGPYAIGFAGDSDTGIYSDAANVVNVQAGGVQTLEITAAGATIAGATAVNDLTVAGDLTVQTGYVGGPKQIVDEPGTARTIALTNFGELIRLTGASSCALTVEANSVINYGSTPHPFVVFVRVAAAGIPTLVPGGGVTINDPRGVIAALVTGDTFGLQWVDTDTWDVI